MESERHRFHALGHAAQVVEEFVLPLKAVGDVIEDLEVVVKGTRERC